MKNIICLTLGFLICQIGLSQKDATLLPFPKEGSIPGDLLEKADSLRQGQEYDAAITAYRQILSDSLTGAIGDSIRINCYEGLGRSYRASKKYELALDNYDFASRLVKEKRGMVNLKMAELHHLKAVAYFQSRNYEEAINSYKVQEAVLESLLELNTSETSQPEKDLKSSLGDAYYNIGRTYYYIKDYLPSIAYYEKSAVIRTELHGEMHDRVASCYGGMGYSYSAIGDHYHGFVTFNRQLEILKTIHPEGSFALANSFAGVGHALLYGGEFERAKDYFNKGLDVLLGLVDEDDIRTVQFYTFLGLVSTLGYQYEEALFYFDKALELNIEYKGEAYLPTANSYTNIGKTHAYIKKDYELAIEYYKKSLSIREQFKDYAALENSHSNLGESYFAMEDYELAEVHFRKAHDYYQMRDLPTAQNSMRLLYDIKLARSIQSQNRLAESQLIIDSVQSNIIIPPIDSLNLVRSFPVMITALREVATFYTEQYGYTYSEAALLEAKRLLALSLDLIEKRLFQVNKTTKDQLLKDVQKRLELSIFCDSKLSELHQQPYSPSLFAYSEKGKGYLLLESIYKSNAIHYAQVPDSIRKLESTLRVKIANLEKQLQSSGHSERSILNTKTTKAKAALYSFNKEYDALQSSLENDYPDYHRFKYRLQTANLEETQQKILSEGRTLLEYFVGDSSIYVFLVQPNNYLVKEVKKDFPLDSLVENMRQGLYSYYRTPPQERSDAQLGGLTQQYIAASRQLYQKLIAPVADQLTESIVIVPDGVLGYVPFEALLSEEVQNMRNFSTYPYLLREHNVSYTYSATLLKEMQDKKHRKKPKESLLAFAPFYEEGYEHVQDLIAGKVLLNSVDASGTIALKNSFDPLPNSGVEAATVATAWNGDYYLGKDATEVAFNEEAGDYRILHLSTHGVADYRVGDYSYLAFAEIPDSIENELLYVRDLYNLQLNADLVVLSACETGIGELQRGEGIISLARAFAYAGAKSIVTTLWVADDAATKDLMIDFYRQLKAGKSKDEALRQAKLNYLEGDGAAMKRHPFFWAGFVGVGDMKMLN